MNKTDYNPQEDVDPILELKKCVLCLKNKWIPERKRVCSKCQDKR